MRFVLDTSVMVSAIRSRTGASALLLDHALTWKYDLLLSAPLFLEYEKVLQRQEHLQASGFTAQDIDLLLARLAQVCIGVRKLGPALDLSLPDRDDEHILRLAWRSGADALVTQNLRHFAAGAHALGVNCCRPGEALRLLEI